ncbi:hypothetical protein [Sphingosinithalassobacter sp. LHW66-3]|uniref:hypothetical protein n=1 Tax=Sphingosinithalassobacter sp. LHW66-3 TaxID=3424718 RepID=UPI003D6C2E5E
MAEIPIEKKKGVPGWIWAVLALIILALLLWAFLGDDDDDVLVTEPVPVTAPAETTPMTDNMAMETTESDAPITDLTTITGATDNSIVGREVDLTGINVVEMRSDAGFWIADASGERVYVVLDEEIDRSNNVEGRVNVDAGDTVAIRGAIRDAAGGIPEDTVIYNDRARPLPDGVERYIYAQVVTK